jgi:C-terminal processing protease CtpA/Prc
MDWIENQFVVTRVQKGKSEGVAPGDRILKIDGKPTADAAAAGPRAAQLLQISAAINPHAA